MPEYASVKVRRELADAVEAVIADGSLGYRSVSDFFSSAGREKLQALRGLCPSPSSPPAPGATPGPPPAAAAPSGPVAPEPAPTTEATRAVPSPRPSGHSAQGDPATPHRVGPSTPAAEDNEAPEAAGDVQAERPAEPAARDGAPQSKAAAYEKLEREMVELEHAEAAFPVPAPGPDARSTVECGKCGATYGLDERAAHRKVCDAKPAGPAGVRPLDEVQAPRPPDVARLERFVKEFAESGRLGSTDKKAYLLAAVERGLEVQGAAIPEDRVLEEFLSRISSRVPAVQRALEASG